MEPVIRKRKIESLKAQLSHNARSSLTGHQIPRVLVVDDEQVIADTLTAILTQSGYDTRAAYSGVAAIEMARLFQPDVLLTDVVMPDINGVEVAIKVREMLPACKVLLHSAHATTSHLLAMARNQEFELLAKPLQPAELRARLRDALLAGQPAD